MDKSKFDSLMDFERIISQSWTWERMTKQEKHDCISMLEDPCSIKAYKGTYDQRISILNALYNAYLVGLGYKDGFWREQTEEANPKEELWRTRKEYLFKVTNMPVPKF